MKLIENIRNQSTRKVYDEQLMLWHGKLTQVNGIPTLQAIFSNDEEQIVINDSRQYSLDLYRAINTEHLPVELTWRSYYSQKKANFNLVQHDHTITLDLSEYLPTKNPPFSMIEMGLLASLEDLADVHTQVKTAPHHVLTAFKRSILLFDEIQYFPYLSII